MVCPRALAGGLLSSALAVATPARGYSVLTHEANIDAAWDPAIKPLLMQRYPRVGPAALLSAKAYAYGGSVIQDLGYYPFGSRFFSNLVHYVRSGDFVEALLADARDVNEYAFALGALAHYAADNAGHPLAVNRSVPLMFPKLAAKYGPEVKYAQSPTSHIVVEFSFDVVQAAAGAYLPESYHSFVGFQVAAPLLGRAFRETYGLDLKSVFVDIDLAIGTYRHAVSEVIPQITEIAWRDKREEIARVIPSVEQQHFVFHLSRQEYEQEYGANYRKPGLIARLLAFAYKVLPKIGPLRPLKFQAPTPEAEMLFLDSFKTTRERYRAALDAIAKGRLDLANTDFDTGQRTRHGEYELADETYAKLLDKITKHDTLDVPKPLIENINRFYGPAGRLASGSHKEQKRLTAVRREFATLNRQL